MRIVWRIKQSNQAFLIFCRAGPVGVGGGAAGPVGVSGGAGLEGGDDEAE